MYGHPVDVYMCKLVSMDTPNFTTHSLTPVRVITSIHRYKGAKLSNGSEILLQGMVKQVNLSLRNKIFA
jgi:hypothetical protein